MRGLHLVRRDGDAGPAVRRRAGRYPSLLRSTDHGADRIMQGRDDDDLRLTTIAGHASDQCGLPIAKYQQRVALRIAQRCLRHFEARCTGNSRRFADHLGVAAGQRGKLVADYGQTHIDLVRTLDWDYVRVPAAPKDKTYSRPQMTGPHSWIDDEGNEVEMDPVNLAVLKELRE